MRSPEQLEVAVFGSLARADYWFRDARSRCSLLHMNLEPAELMRFEAHRLAKVQPTAVSNLLQWSSVPGSETSGNIELDRFQAAINQLNQLSKFVQAGETNSNDGNMLRQAVWHYLQTMQTDHERERSAIELDISRDATRLNYQDQTKFNSAMSELTESMMSESDDRMTGLRDCNRNFTTLARTTEGARCPSILFRAGWLSSFLTGDRAESSERLKQCIKVSDGAPTVTNWMAHRLLASLAAADEDFGEADYWMLQGATFRSSAFAMYEAGLYAGRNERKKDCRMLFSRALEAQALPVLMVLADRASQECASDLFSAIVSSQQRMRTEGKKNIGQWAATAEKVEEVAGMIGRESIASLSLMKDHHRFLSDLPYAELVTSGYMTQRSLVCRKYLIDEASITLRNDFADRTDRVQAKRHEIDRERALQQVKRKKVKDELEEEVSEAKCLHRSSCNQHKKIEMGCSAALGLGVAGIGTFLIMAIMSAFSSSSASSKSGSGSPVGVVVVVVGMIPVGLMMATHVVHGLFSHRATGELSRLLQASNAKYEEAIEAIDNEADAIVEKLDAELTELEYDRARGAKALATFGILSSDHEDASELAA